MAKVSYYFDEMMPRKVASQLVERGYSVVMAVDVDMVEKDDLDEHLAYATEHQLVLVTFDRPFSTKAMTNVNHTGLICWTGTQNDFGGQVIRFSEFADQHILEDVIGKVFWIKR